MIKLEGIHRVRNHAVVCINIGVIVKWMDIRTRRMAIANGTCVSFCNQPKAHFGLPWDNRGKCHMDEKRIQCLLNALHHVPIYLQPFPSSLVQPVSSKVRHFSTFFALFGLPWVRPWDNRGIHVTWMERGFNAGQTHCSIYPSIFNRLRAIARYWSEIATFFLSPCI